MICCFLSGGCDVTSYKILSPMLCCVFQHLGPPVFGLTSNFNSSTDSPWHGEPTSFKNKWSPNGHEHRYTCPHGHDNTKQLMLCMSPYGLMPLLHEQRSNNVWFDRREPAAGDTLPEPRFTQLFKHNSLYLSSVNWPCRPKLM